MTDERSGSGAPIHRHEAAVDPTLSAGDPGLVDAVSAHVGRHLGPPADVWHEIVSAYVHIDVHVVAPGPERPAITLVTSGMSERPMAAPDGDRYAELTMVLPPSWPLPGSPGFERPQAYWPFGLLQDLARLPHEFDTFLWAGHTVPNDDPPRPYARGTRLCGALLAPQLVGPDGFDTLRYGDREIHILGVMPLHADEMRLKLDHGLDALHDRLDEAGVTEILDPGRPSVVGKRRRVGRR